MKKIWFIFILLSLFSCTSTKQELNVPVSESEEVINPVTNNISEMNYGYVQLNEDSEYFRRKLHYFDGDSIRDLYYDNNNVYIGSMEGDLNKYNITTGQIEKLSISELNTGPIYRIDRNDNAIIAATVQSIFYSNDNGASWHRTNNPVFSWDIMSDGRNTYVTCFEYIQKFNDNNMNSIAENIFPEDPETNQIGFITSIIKNTRNEIIVTLDNDSRSYMTSGILKSDNEGLSWNRVSEIMTPTDSIIEYNDNYFAGCHDGLYILDHNFSKLRHMTFNEGNINYPRVYSMNTYNNFLFIALNDEISKSVILNMDTYQYLTIDYSNIVHTYSTYTILPVNDEIWIGTQDGIFVLDQKIMNLFP